MRLDRLLAIINILLNRRRISARTLAEHFEVSIRTVYRDLNSINLAGIPIVSFPGNDGGFGIMENYRLDRQLFTFQDMVSTLSILKGVNQSLKDKQVAATIEKISSLVPSEQKQKLQLQSEQIVVDVLPWGSYPKHKQKLADIQNALSHDRLLKCTYVNSSGEKNTRVIEPMTIVFKGSSWYLYGYCRRKRDFRIFRVTRMLNLRILKQTFARRPGSYRDLEASEKSLPLVKVKMKFKPQLRFRVADYLDANLFRFNRDGSICATLALPDMDWLYTFLLGFGENVEILGPPHVRETLKLKTEKIARLYNPDIQLSQPQAILPEQIKRRQ